MEVQDSAKRLLLPDYTASYCWRPQHDFHHSDDVRSSHMVSAFQWVAGSTKEVKAELQCVSQVLQYVVWIIPLPFFNKEAGVLGE